MQAANFTCSECEAKDKPLHVHHCYYAGKDPWVQVESDKNIFKVLCEDCHEDRGNLEHDVKLEFARLLAMLSSEAISSLMPQILEAQGDETDGITLMNDNQFEWYATARWFLHCYVNSNEPKYKQMYDDVLEEEKGR